MTLIEIVFSIPGLITLSLAGPVLLLFAFQVIRDCIERFHSQVQNCESQSVRAQNSDTTPHKELNVIDFDTAAAITFIRKHDAMRFVSKR